MGTFDMIKKAHDMRKQMKTVQKNLAKHVAEAVSGGVTAVARGDMTLDAVKIDISKIDVNNIELLQKQITAAVNKAFSDVQKSAAEEMTKAAGGLGGLADMLR